MIESTDTCMLSKDELREWWDNYQQAEAKRHEQRMIELDKFRWGLTKGQRICIRNNGIETKGPI